MLSSASCRRIFNGFMRRCDNFLDRPWVIFLGPMVIVVPYSFLLAYFQIEQFQSGVQKHLPLIAGFVDGSPVMIIVLATIYFYSFPAFDRFVRAYNRNNGIDAGSALKLFKVLEEIVGAKDRRFGITTSKVVAGENISPDQAFDTITQPHQQIALLVQGVHTFFDAINSKNVKLRVSAVTIRDGAPDCWLYYWPTGDPPRTPIEILRSPDSSICTAVRKRKLVVIEDRQKETRNGGGHVWKDAGVDAGVEGSLLCYPVWHHYTTTIPYVLTIVADEKGYFRNAQVELYEWILRHFAVRIGLEHSLVLLKERACGEDHGKA